MKFPKYKEEMDKLLKDDINNIICTITESPDYVINQITISPSSNYIAYIHNNKIKVFDLKGQQEYSSITETDRTPTAIVFNESEKHLIVGGTKSTIRVYNFATRALVFELPAQDSMCTTLSYVAHTNEVVAGFDNGNVNIYFISHSQKGGGLQRQHQLPGFNSLALTPDQRFAICCASDKLMTIELETQEVIQKIDIKRNTENLLPVVVSSSSKYIAINTADFDVDIHVFETLERKKRFTDPRKVSLKGFALTQDEKLLVTLTSDSAMVIFDILQEHVVCLLRGLTERPSGFCLSPNERFFCIPSTDGHVNVWQFLEDTDILQVAAADEMQGSITQFCELNENIVLGCENGDIKVYNPVENRFVCSLTKAHSKKINAIISGYDAESFFTGSSDKTYKKFRIKKEGTETIIVEEFTSKEMEHAVIVVEKFPKQEDQKIIIGVKSGSLMVINAENNEILKSSKGKWWSYTDIANDTKLSYDSEHLIVGDDYGSLAIMKMAKKIGKKTAKYDFDNPKWFKNLHSTPITAVEISHDSKYAITGSRDQFVKIVSLKTFRVKNIRSPPENSQIICIKLTKNDKFMLVACEKSYSIYDMRSRSLIHTVTFKVTLTFCNFTYDQAGVIATTIDGGLTIEKFKFLQQPTAIDTSLYVPYRGMSRIPFYKLQNLWNNHISLNFDAVQSYNRVLLIPYNVNSWHFFMMCENYNDVVQIINYIIDADVPIINDYNDENIIHYMVQNKMKVGLNTLFKRSDEAFDNAPTEIYKSLSLCFNDLMATRIPTIVNFLEHCYYEAQHDVDKEQDKIQIGNVRKAIVALCESTIVPNKIKRGLIEDGSDPITFFVSKIKFHEVFYSDKSLYLLESIIKNKQDKNLYRSVIINKIVTWGWQSAFWYLVGLLTFNFGFYAALIIYAQFENPPFGWEIVMLIYNSLVAGYELVQCMGHPKNYLTSPWNIIDLIRISFLYVGVIFSSSNVGRDAHDEEESLTKWFLSISLFFNFAKMISFFRIFKTTRNLIRVITEVIKDMFSFCLICMTVIVGFSFIFFAIDQDQAVNSNIFDVYMMAFAEWDTTKYEGLEMLYFLIVSFFLTIVMLNLLIAIISDTYARVQADALPTDNIEKLDLLIESQYVIRVLRKIFCVCKKKKDVTRYLKHFVWAAETTGEDEGNEDDAGAEWEGRVKEIKKEIAKRLGTLSSETLKHQKNLDKKLGMLESMYTSFQEVQSRNDTTHEQVKQLQKEILLLKKHFNIQEDANYGTFNKLPTLI